ncbi:S8 family peptidase [Cytobacillus sp. S13-E01]|uniref:S8 family peptidase n=1 Tax=Cytobacillus sp. S13-E01 TaxID=3031326 RepID=UPI0023D85141|nr:S8 family peptidase [Cytobacillus sp. S13-E01]MDF0726053.1 S8 family peptidase [Cytobacillus sp. S13-E01]
MKKAKKSFLSVGLAASMLFVGSTSTFALDTTLKTTEDKQLFLKRLGFSQDEKVQASVAKTQNEEAFSKDTLIVKYSTPLTVGDHNKAGAKLVKRFSTLGYDVVQITGKKTYEEVIKAYATLKGVEKVSPSANITRFGSPDVKAKDMYYLETLRMAQASNLAGDHKVKVAVIDTGIDVDHPELKNKIVKNYNILNPMQKGAVDVHGTHVAGIIAAEKDNGLGGYGINPNVDIVSIDVFSRSWSSSDFTVADGILKAIDEKVQVINMSLGSSYASPIIEDAVKKAVDAGIIIVAAAGNSGLDMKNYPAAFEGVISVGATNAQNKLAEFSSFGSFVDVVAPGEDIYAPVFDVDKQSSFTELSGTSMATPIVAGVVSLMLSKNPDLTAQQVNYILNKTAIDLGETGYDTKYGHGLVNPVGALMFKAKGVPVFETLSESELLEKAQKLDFDNSISKTANIKYLDQIDYYQVAVNKGEYIQSTLKGTENYDYKYDLLFYPEGETEPSKEVNIDDAVENSSEGNLFIAPENGTIVIAVKDRNGNYSESGKSTYELSLTRQSELFEDDNTLESPVTITSLPYDSGKTGPFYFTNTVDVPENARLEEIYEIPGDSDIFKFKATKNETVKISVSDVPGIDSTINLQVIEKFEDFEYPWTIDSSNRKGFGQGEELTFSAQEGMEYIVEVTNKPFSYYDPYMFLYYGYGMELDLTRNYSSNIPYTLGVESKELPADEDGYPDMGYFSGGMVTETEVIYFNEKKENAQKAILDPYFYPSDGSFLGMVSGVAIPYMLEEQKTGYFQSMGDEDWYAFTPEVDGIYELSFASDQANEIPLANVYTVNTEINDLMYLTGNAVYGYNGVTGNDKLQVGLKAYQTYYINLTNKDWQASFKSYTFTSSLLVEDVMDEYENNDTYEEATDLFYKPITGNFAAAGDTDIYYVETRRSGTYGVALKPLAAPKEYQNLRKELLAPIDPVIAIIEDRNGNRKVDQEETGNMLYINNGLNNDEERGSFTGKEGAGYFIVAFDYFSTTTLTPYELQLSSNVALDEDRDSVVKNNVPSKPLTLKAEKGALIGKGKLNITSNKGDADYFKLSVTKEQTHTIKLDIPSDLDGVVTLYDAKGNLVAKADNYGRGDAEYLVATLKKGDYYIKVNDVFGNASINEYSVTVTK